ncbi:MAG: 1-deoxy-D-xylulose-5-phosphate synthase [Bacteroidota bacterium]
MEYKFLDTIDIPDDLKKLSVDDLPLLSEEVRQFIIDVISSNPGHLGASLGAVELAVALHYVYNTPDDKIVWDVGHQAYAHKILTGRKHQFSTNRQLDGLSGFPRMSESEYDAFGVGHSSTSVSAILGMAVASALNNENHRKHVAVIGDGSMTAGMAFEAMNHAGVTKADMLIVLNDNGIAIDKNVGALSQYLTDIRTSRIYNKVKTRIWNMLGRGKKYGPNTRALVRQIDKSIKTGLLKRGNLFEALKLRYFGPVDGHDVVRLVQLLKDLKNIPGPKILHCITVKGKGLKYAEKNQTVFHAPGVFNKKTGEIMEAPCKTHVPKYQVVFGKSIIELAEKNHKIVGVTPAMPTGCSLNLMMAKMPHRAFDVGIAEQHAVTFSAGMAVQGLVPFCNIYSSFMQRAYDQLIHDVALQGLQVVFCLDRGGLVGEDGATHQGAYDLAYLRAIPGLMICSPMNEVELRNMMYTAQLEGMGPTAIRYPKGRGVTSDWKQPFTALTPGKGRMISEGEDIAMISIGHPGNFVVEAAKLLAEENIHITHCDIRYLKPIDEELLHQIFKNHKEIITLEDGTIKGGLGSAVLEFMNLYHYHANIQLLGIPDEYIEQATQEEQYKLCGFDVDSIVKVIRNTVHSRLTVSNQYL